MNSLFEYPPFKVNQDKYSELLSFCQNIANEQIHFCKNFKEKNKTLSKENFITGEIIKLANTSITDNLSLTTTTNKFLDFLSKNFQESILNRKFINNYLKENPGLWVEFMNTFPLDQYAIGLGEFLIEENLLKGNILELGAGVGNTSHIIYPHITVPEHYRRTDINIMLLRSSKQKENISFYDFDTPGKWNNQDLIFATNALHCATDKEASFKHIYNMLSEDGHFIICEGTPETSKGIPWALNFACGYFDGWWNKGGFIPNTNWISIFESTGFKNIKIKKIMAGNYHLGNIIWGQK